MIGALPTRLEPPSIISAKTYGTRKAVRADVSKRKGHPALAQAASQGCYVLAKVSWGRAGHAQDSEGQVVQVRSCMSVGWGA